MLTQASTPHDPLAQCRTDNWLQFLTLSQNPERENWIGHWPASGTADFDEVSISISYTGWEARFTWWGKSKIFSLEKGKLKRKESLTMDKLSQEQTTSSPAFL